MIERQVYMVSHAHAFSDHVDSKFIGIFSTTQQASDAVTRLRSAEGFSEFPEGFFIQQLTVDEIRDSKN